MPPKTRTPAGTPRTSKVWTDQTWRDRRAARQLRYSATSCRETSAVDEKFTTFTGAAATHERPSFTAPPCDFRSCRTNPGTHATSSRHSGLSISRCLRLRRDDARRAVLRHASPPAKPAPPAGTAPALHRATRRPRAARARSTSAADCGSSRELRSPWGSSHAIVSAGHDFGIGARTSSADGLRSCGSSRPCTPGRRSTASGKRRGVRRNGSATESRSSADASTT